MIGQAANEHAITLMKSRRLIVTPEARTSNGSNLREHSGGVGLGPPVVRFGSKADMGGSQTHVRLAPNINRESRHLPPADHQSQSVQPSTRDFPLFPKRGRWLINFNPGAAW